MNKKLLITIIAIVIVVILVAFWLWKEKKQQSSELSKNPNVTEKQETVKNEQNQDQDSMEEIDQVIKLGNGWNLYRNTKYGFEFKYPDHLKGERFTEAEKDNVTFAKFFTADKSGGLSLEIKNEKFDLNSVEGLYGPISKENIEEIKINENLKVYSYRSGDAGCGGDIVNIPNSEKTITMQFTDCDDYYIKILPQKSYILSSFGFID